MERGLTVWLCGLPCSGKTTIARGVTEHWDAINLDGDVVRKGLCSDLGFTVKDREENIRRVAEVAELLNRAGKNVVASFITPTEDIRNMVRDTVDKLRLVAVIASEDACRERDVKGMWKMADEGKISDFTGVDAEFEDLKDADESCFTEQETVDESIHKVLRLINQATARALYIGRWQPLHDGHRYIIQQALEEKHPVMIGVRNMLPDDSNPYSAEEVKSMLEEEYRDEDVVVEIIPNIHSIRYGRKVGYDVVKVEAPEEIKRISATDIRSDMTCQDCSETD